MGVPMSPRCVSSGMSLTLQMGGWAVTFPFTSAHPLIRLSLYPCPVCAYNRERMLRALPTRLIALLLAILMIVGVGWASHRHSDTAPCQQCATLPRRRKVADAGSVRNDARRGVGAAPFEQRVAVDAIGRICPVRPICLVRGPKIRLPEQVCNSAPPRASLGRAPPAF